MQTIREQVVERSRTGTAFNQPFSVKKDSQDRSAKLKTGEFISWAVCCGIVATLTGLLLFLRIGVTMETITTSLFYLSVAGLIYFVIRIILLSKSNMPSASGLIHELN